MLATLLTLLRGRKTYLSALGLFGLAAYQLSTGDYGTALQSVLAGLAAIGVRDAIARQPTVIPVMVRPSDGVRPADLVVIPVPPDFALTPDHSTGRDPHGSR